MRRSCVVLIMLLAVPARAVVVENALFQDNAVLQRRVQVPVFGTAASGEQVTVTYPLGESSEQTQQITPTCDSPPCPWIVYLDAMETGVGTLRIAGSNTIQRNNVAVGEVWLAVGQSNLMTGSLDGYNASLQTNHPEVHVRVGWNATPRWTNVPPATAFWFGLELAAALGVPIGVIVEAVGSSEIPGWSAPSALADPDPDVATILNADASAFSYYNAYIAPHQPYAIAGLLWWQGDIVTSNGLNTYTHLQPAILRWYRADWVSAGGLGAFPFIMIQLPSGGGLSRKEIPPSTPPSTTLVQDDRQRNLYFDVAAAQPPALVVPSSDLDGGEHPNNVASYAQRAAWAALGRFYGLPTRNYAGPRLDGMTLSGSTVHLRFRDGTADNLVGLGSSSIQGLSVAGTNGVHYWASALLDGPNGLAVSSPSVPEPKTVRYGKYGSDYPNLFNGNGLAAAQFSVPVTAISACCGDCDNSAAVSQSEVGTCTLIAGGSVLLSTCPACDCNGDGTVTASEVALATAYMNEGCPSPTATLQGSVALQGRPNPPDTQWIVPVRVQLTPTGQPTPTIDETVSTDTSGIFTLSTIPPATYDVRVKNSHTLQRLLTSVTLVAGVNTQTVGTLREGDASGDNLVDGLDYSQLVAAFGACTGAAGFNPQADFSADGCVFGEDHSLLVGNFGAAGEGG